MEDNGGKRKDHRICNRIGNNGAGKKLEQVSGGFGTAGYDSETDLDIYIPETSGML